MSGQPSKSFWWRLVYLNPALFRSLIMATVLLLGSLGVSIATDVPDALITWVSVSMLVIQALWTESATEPKAKVAVAVPDPVNHPEVVAPGDAGTTAPSEEILAAARMIRP